MAQRENTLQEDLASETERHKKNIAWIKERHKFRDGDINLKVKMIQKTDEGHKLTQFWNILDVKGRMDVAKLMLSKSHSCRVWIHPYHFMGSSKDFYSVEIILKPVMFIRVRTELTSKPDEAQALQWVQEMFPSIKVIQTK